MVGWVKSTLSCAIPNMVIDHYLHYKYMFLYNLLSGLKSLIRCNNDRTIMAKGRLYMCDFIDRMLRNIWLGNEGVGKHPLF
jgi:hypothetical protein